MRAVGIIDSGAAPGLPGAARAFDADGAGHNALPDRLGHGTAVARTILRACPSARLVHAQVFDARPVTSALRVAAALDWLVARGDVGLVCLSLGLSADRTVLAEAVARAQAAGLVLVAAHPARGPAPWPAAYPGVIAGTGDARCDWEALSRLGPQLFGAWCNSPEHGGTGMGGASLGTARLAGHVAAIMADGAGTSEAVLDALARRAGHHGAERKTA
ncbi:S8/S53 family peptidase [Salipiger thiooxidans]|uniref:subtilisin-like serine protease QhpE n=1 Tax=Salipiger thiooxidans TaxID=282683 RepID=UPI001A9027CB|nr:S8/S53 family peptidase [Salipiger thiooxidans]MBN8185914.1 S8/S53 family peptidase [Salipiger thiooxidans]